MRRHHHRRRLPYAVLPLLLAAVLGVVAPGAQAAVRPLVSGVSVADPSVEVTKDKHYVLVATGEQVVRMTSGNGRRWRMASPALVTRPSWAKPTGGIWASDIARLRGRWVLYYSAPVNGLSSSSRCIGVAISASPTGQFTPYGAGPLVCPPDADTPLAEDPILDAGQSEPTVPTHGAIDPSLFRGPDGPWLLYKTDGTPSAIRIVPLSANGLDVAGGSRQLLVSSGVLENPAMVKVGRFFYLFNSVGDYTRCSYQTVYRRSTSLLSWSRKAAHPILTKAKTKLCGPGGADVMVRGRGRKATLSVYFHAWTCRGTGKPCREPFHAWDGQEDYRRPVRALYGVKLGFTKRRWLARDEWITRKR